ncbi:hypothetical protein BC940DRAFT_299679 [Gongronella butleri]|nr:hypothetical protein BC940DRAFT_299679 [Gongronella butleri]
MQIDRSTSSSNKARRRPSYINLAGTQAVQDDLLSPRTPKSISKSRRGSVAGVEQGAVQDAFEAKVPTRSDSLKRLQKKGESSGSGHATGPMAPLASEAALSSPPLLSDRTTPAYFDMDSVPLAAVAAMTPAAQAVAAHLRAQQSSHPSTPNYTHAFQRLSVNDRALPSNKATASPSSSSKTSSSTSNSSGSRHSPNRQRASSISSISDAKTSMPSTFDGHTMYRVKAAHSHHGKKRDHHDDYAHPDISVRQIRKEGLKALLRARVPLCYFLFHLLEEYSHENLFFHIELEQYESFEYISLVQQLATAQHIYNTYLTRNSHFEVNLDDRVRRQVKEALERKDVSTCFETAKRSVYSLLESSYMRFLTTKIYQRMLKDCGESTTHYKEETRYAAVNVLLAYIEREHNMIYTNPLTDTPVFQSVSQTTRRRHELIKSMIHEFCRTLVGVEFSYYRLDPDTMEQQLVQAESSRTPSPQESKSPRLLPLPKFDFLKRK